jgi:hypothetical protein
MNLVLGGIMQMAKHDFLTLGKEIKQVCKTIF